VGQWKNQDQEISPTASLHFISGGLEGEEGGTGHASIELTPSKPCIKSSE